MAKQQFNKLIWLVDTIFRNGPVTFAEINRRWRAGDGSRVDIPCGLSTTIDKLSRRCSTSTLNAISGIIPII